MSFPKSVARYRAPCESPKGLSSAQLLALHVAANYMLAPGIGGWIPDNYDGCFMAVARDTRHLP